MATLATETEQILSFEKCIGSNCRGVENLLLVDSDTLAFKSGQFLYYFAISTKILTSTKCNDGSIGAIAKNMHNDHLAIAENGFESKIYIRSYRSMKIVSICSSEPKDLCYLSYSSSGELLASQSNAPEFEVTIWNWHTATIILNFKSAQISENFDLQFSIENDRFLYTGGAKQLHFWNIVRTFTGLKLLHKSGHFGKYNTCDILTICAANGNRLLTNCEWGNILVWENGHIKFEICRKNRQPCHNAAITQIALCNEYLYSIGIDNYVRIWFWDSILINDMRENDKIIEFEAIYEFKINASIPSSNDLLSFAIYPGNEQFCCIHDGNGVIWKCKIDSDFTSHKLEEIFRTSSKDLICLSVSPVSTHLITLDVRGVLCVYNYVHAAMVFRYRFLNTSCSLAWCSKKVDDSGKTVVFGFLDGSICITCFDINENEWNSTSIRIIQHTKPHSSKVKQMLTNDKVLVSMSEDQTVFIYKIVQSPNGVLLTPVGFIPIKMPSLQMAYFDCAEDQQMLIVASENNTLMKVTISSKMKSDENSYLLRDAIDYSDKIQVSHQMHLLKIINERYLWILLSDGSLYEYDFCTADFILLKSANNICYFEMVNKKYILFCYKNCDISVEHIESSHPIKFTSLYTFKLPHNFEMISPCMKFNADSTNLFIYDSNGSILSYKWELAFKYLKNENIYKKCTIEHHFVDEDIFANCPSLEEQKHIESENRRKSLVHQRKVEILEIITKLKNEFAAIKDRNNKLPDKYQLSTIAFEIDRRINDDIEWRAQRQFKVIQRELQKKIDKIRTQSERMEHIYLDNLEHWPITITGFRSPKMLETHLIYEINDEFQALKIQFEGRDSLDIANFVTSIENNRVEQKLTSNLTDTSCDSLIHLNEFTSMAENIDKSHVEFQAVLTKTNTNFRPTLCTQLQRLYKRYTARKQQDIERKQQWKKIENMEPRSNSVKSVQENTKSDTRDADFQSQSNQFIIEKYRTLKLIMPQITNIKRNFNDKVLALQEEKLEKCIILSDKIDELQKVLKKLYPKDKNIISIKEKTEKSIQYDGKSFKEIIIRMKEIDSQAKKFQENITMEKHQMDIWTAELHKKRSLLFRQIESIYQDFDAKIEANVEESIETLLKIHFMELYYMELYQEVLVLNTFENPHKALLKSIDEINNKMRKNEEEIQLAKSKLKEQMGDNALVDINGKIIELEVLFKSNDSSICNQQLEILKKIDSLTMPLAEVQTIKALIKSTADLLKERIILDKDFRGVKYALKKMLEEKEMQLNNIDVLIMLPEDRFRTLKSTETNTFNDCVLVKKSRMSRINEQLSEYESETLNEYARQSVLQTQLNHIKSTCTKMKIEINSLRAEVDVRMMKKFGMKIDFDEMEEAVLTKLLMQQWKNNNKMKDEEEDIRKIKQILENKNNELIAVKQQQIEKYNTLIALQGALNVINEEQRYHEKVRGKYLLAAQNKMKEENELKKLQIFSKHQRQQIGKITKEIQTFRLKMQQQDPILSIERNNEEQRSPPILTFPAGYIPDACEDSPQTNQNTQSHSLDASEAFSTSASSASSN